MFAHAAFKRCLCSGPNAPRQVKARHRITVARTKAAAAFCPSHNRKPPHAHIVQPAAHRTRSKIDIGFGPFARPCIFGPVKLRRPHPVLQRQFAAVSNAHPALFGTVDQHQPAKRPECLPAQKGFGFLIDDNDLFTAICQLGCGDQTGQPAADDNNIRRVHAKPPTGLPRRRSFMSAGSMRPAKRQPPNGTRPKIGFPTTIPPKTS